MTTEFEQHRAYLTGLAYRMLGSVAEAEDAVQDAYLRWHDTDSNDIESTRAFLTTVVSRICLDRLKSAQRKRETYVGTWLPEPVVDTQDNEGLLTENENALAKNISVALMLALERLSPLERAAFLLHDVFNVSFAEVARTLNREEAACRQLAKRARDHIMVDRPRFSMEAERSQDITQAFYLASRSGDVQTLQQLLQEDAILHSDGGGKRVSAINCIIGSNRIVRFYQGLLRKHGDMQPKWSQAMRLNGAPGWLTVEKDGLLQATSVSIRDGRITDIYVVRNPDKLRHLQHWVPVSLA